jgi:hypothetical protein
LQAATENGQDETHAGSAAAPKRKKRAWEEDSGGEGPDSEDERERQRQEDQRAKEDFEQRLRERDEAKTRKLMEAKLSREEIEVCFLADVPLIPYTMMWLRSAKENSFPALRPFRSINQAQQRGELLRQGTHEHTMYQL